MTTIVMNTLTAAVSEYDWAFQSITPTHAGSATGLFALGGNLDGELPIDAVVTTGKTLWGSSLKKRVDGVYFSLTGTGSGLLRVIGKTLTRSYTFAMRAAGVSRVPPGKGINENYLAFGFSNVAGADFQLDRIEIPLVPSTTRRI